MALKFELIRPDDLLHLQVEAHNLQVDFRERKKLYLVQQNREQPSYLVFTFPPQTIAETAFYEFSSTPPPAGQPNPDAGNTAADQDPKQPPGSVEASIARPSRLVFRLPPASDEARLPLTIEGLLDWAGLSLNVSEAAAIPAGQRSLPGGQPPDIKAPAPLETAIELPYRLVISPNDAVAWQHALKPVSHNGRTELWHTRLALSADDLPLELDSDHKAPLRAIWSPDFDPFTPPKKPDLDPHLGLSAMSPNDRHQLVILMAGYKGYRTRVYPQKRYIPLPVQAEMLMLSSLGGWLRSRGAWDPPETGDPPFIIGPIDLGDILDPIFSGPGDFFPGRARLAPHLRELRDAASSAAAEERAAPAEAASEQPAPSTDAAAFANLNFAELADFDLVIQPPFPVFTPAEEILDLSEWVHVAAQGRDHYVRIVYEGNLYPFGHRAALIKITERKFQEFGTNPVAYMIQRMFIVVREPERDYTQIALQHSGRGMPLKRVRFTTRVTPDIAYPYDADVQVPGSDGSFWVRVGDGAGGKTDFRFQLRGMDVRGEWSDFTAALIFVPFSEAQVATVPPEYRVDDARRACTVPNLKVSYADPDAALSTDNTTLDTVALYFDTQDLPAKPTSFDFKPRLFKADVHVPAVENLLGTDQPTTIRLFQDYLDNAFANAGGVFAEIMDASGLNPANLDLGFSADKAGGIATPNMGVSSLSRRLGPLAGELADAAADNFDPTKFFPSGSALLFGAIDLAALLLTGALGDKAPKLEIETQEVPQGRRIITHFTWNPEVKNPPDIGILRFIKDISTQNGNETTLDIQGRLEKTIQLPGAPPGGVGEDFVRFEGTLTNFALEFLRVIALQFASFKFTSETGKKTDVKVDLHESEPVTFLGDLEFVNQLAEIIPPGTFGDGPSLDINLTRIRAGFAITLPPATVGVFAMKNLRLSAGLELPFLTGKPQVDFGFASREDPFLITVSLLGGGGYFLLVLDTQGILLLELALEFGASADLNLGVASGSVHIMAGIFVSMQLRDGDLAAVLGGYLRCGGELSVLGLISVSLEFVLSFTYDSGTEKVSGRATLTVEVEVLFFSASVELTVERSYGAKGGDPTFADLFDQPAVWEEYALAFA